MKKQSFVHLIAALGLVWLGACEGSNLFEEAGARGGGGSGGSGTVTIDLTGPSQATRGDTVFVNVLATASAGLSKITLTASGALSGDVTEDVSGTNYGATWFFLPPVGGDTVLVVKGTATDTQGRVSAPDSVKVRLN